MDFQEKVRALNAFEERTKLDANHFIRGALGACADCTKRHSCHDVGAASVCLFLQETTEKRVLHLFGSDNIKLNTGVNSVS